MSNWKDAPHLFWGFNVLDKGYPRIKEPNIIDGLFLDSFNDYMSQEDKDLCRLIARPISDMTDEELNELTLSHAPIGAYTENGKENLRYSLKRYIEQDKLRAKDERHLLSIGVHPFDDDTDVIFKPNI